LNERAIRMQENPA